MKTKLMSCSVIFVALMSVFVFSCKKENPKTIPTITVKSISNITDIAAAGGGEVTSEGGVPVTSKGVCWSTNQNPTIADSKSSDGTGKGSFNSAMTGLLRGTTYYLRAYATNSVGTGYSQQTSFTTMALAQQNTWMSINSFSASARYAATGFVIDGKAYVGLGQVQGGTKVYDFWEYNPQTQAWTRKADYPGVGSYDVTSFVINGKGYLCLGASNTGTNVNDLWEYTPGTNTWLRKANFPGTPRYGARAFVINGNAFVGTGSYGSSSDYLKDMWMYNPISDTWVQKNNFPGDKRSFATSFTIGDYGYFGTGLADGTTTKRDMWKYNSSDDSWSQIPDMPVLPRMGLVNFVINDKAYIGTGYDFSAENNDFYEYNPLTNSWRSFTTANYISPARHSAVGFSIKDVGYIVTGYSTNGLLLSDLWAYWLTTN